MSSLVDFDSLKTKVEKQILTALDFLMLDDQIEADEVVDISKFVLDKLDKTTTLEELYSSFSELISKFKILHQPLQNTLNNLSQSSNV